jgi:hypothetical protein
VKIPGGEGDQEGEKHEAPSHPRIYPLSLQDA